MKSFLMTALAVGVLTTAAQAANYPGNGASGFGGPLGTGSLDVTDTPTSITFTFNRGAGNWNDAGVLYLDTVAGGFTDTSSLTDEGDNGRRAVTGDGSETGKSVVTFAAGFGADYALSIENGYIAVFDIETGAHTFLFGTAQSGSASAASYSITLTDTQMASIGLTANSGQSFSFVASYLNASNGFRSDESIGTFTPFGGNPGGDGDITFTESKSYTLVPEPASLGLAGIVGLLAGRRRRS